MTMMRNTLEKILQLNDQIVKQYKEVQQEAVCPYDDDDILELEHLGGAMEAMADVLSILSGEPCKNFGGG